MPPFPGMGYPLVPGYESVGRIRSVGANSDYKPGECVFVPGSRGFKDVRGLFGGAASQLVVPGARAIRVDEALGERSVLLALAATAHHAIAANAAALPDLVVGHGVLGRLLARLVIAAGGEAADGVGAKLLAPQWRCWLSDRRSCKRHAAQLSA